MNEIYKLMERITVGSMTLIVDSEPVNSGDAYLLETRKKNFFGVFTKEKTLYINIAEPLDYGAVSADPKCRRVVAMMGNYKNIQLTDLINAKWSQ